MADTSAGIQVLRSDRRRKTLALEVHPGGEVWVRAPLDCDEQRIQRFVAARESWIAAQRAFFSQFNPRTPTRAWVTGESHLHLGRRYKLRVVQGSNASVCVEGSALIVTTAQDSDNLQSVVETLVARWRHQQARLIFPVLLASCMQHYRFKDVAKPQLRIQRLAKRWGSLSSRGNMTLHSGLVQAPLACIRYVIFHELCHLVHADHSSAFFSFLAEVCPEWQAHRQRLESLLK